ncbi:amino acid ABC transporter substrate-binding protein [Sansalvadorimonas sp. 2012CJ34-2]|uniref:Amino acid ABC transporter substrate-binding protein n=1 Tax=Parendozoicomonas callyspongiae TaxID=2942213 RepID=A0ABT0PJB1_9GAMM|nr:amino acid ABC transporter substrate-binding protein [Sansalvadorimonas sp. 2012CJ34-2]MCL6271418.1 amino acid ABC transporter substrate-binding protein [Sansalvadorimonas sp. 2012CJ34-2]
MIRRLQATGLAVVMSVFLAACGGSEQSTSTNETAGTPEVSSIKVGMSGGYYPFTFVEKDQLQGFDVDVWNELSNRLDRPVEFVTAPFSSLFGMLDSERIDTISNQITITEERKKKYNFSDVYVFDGAQITVNANINDINSLEDLKGRTVAVNLGSNFEELLRDFDTNNEITIKTYSAGGIEQEVALGRVDAFIMDRLSAAELIKKSGLPLKQTGEPFEVIENAMPYLRTESSEELRLQVNQALKAMREDGTLAEISQKWFGTDVTSKG